jgi:hypothetical protein
MFQLVTDSLVIVLSSVSAVFYKLVLRFMKQDDFLSKHSEFIF